MPRSKKPHAKTSDPQRNALSKALSDELSSGAPAESTESPAPTPRAHKDILVDSDATALVRQFLVEQINALPPSQKTVMANTYNQFMARVVVLAPDQVSKPE
jgi:hypothetical protein